MAETVTQTEAANRWLTADEAHAIFDGLARKTTGFSREEFLRRYDAGEFADMPDDVEHMAFTKPVMLIPWGR